jgi:tRNA threonylcarbamoyladenosine biosynthesis protein TsaB
LAVLAIDTSHPQGAVAVFAGGDRVEATRLEGPSSHLVGIGRAVTRLLSASGSGIRDVDRVAVVIGPGSFTGLRVGLAFVKGLYAASAFDLVTITSLELLSRQARASRIARAEEDPMQVAPMIDARRDEVYAALYEARKSEEWAETVAPCAASPREFLATLPRRSTTFVGSGALRYAGEIERAFGRLAVFPGEGDQAPDVTLLCRIAMTLAPLKAEDIAPLEPLYIRPSDVKLNPLGGLRAYDRHPS